MTVLRSAWQLALAGLIEESRCDPTDDLGAEVLPAGLATDDDFVRATLPALEGGPGSFLPVAGAAPPRPETARGNAADVRFVCDTLLPTAFSTDPLRAFGAIEKTTR